MRFFYRPGQQLKTFEVFRRTASEDDVGRATYAKDPTLVDAVRGTIVQASQREQMTWGQNGHPITHTIVIRGRTKAEAGDELHLADRVWTVQGKHDPVELGFFSTLYCLERLDAANSGGEVAQ